jgi:hypothetical protein
VNFEEREAPYGGSDRLGLEGDESWMVCCYADFGSHSDGAPVEYLCKFRTLALHGPPH